VTAATLRIAGVAPREVVTPRTLDEFSETVRALHDARTPFAFVGGGTELDLGNRPRALDTVVRTVALDRVIEHAPEDQVISVEAGITLAEIDRVLGAKGQMLPLDVVDREHATIGGVLATNAYGRRRQRYGAAKDLIVGVTMVRPDGTLARGGGKVVKNVAGFDLPKLAVGSLGTLGAIATATLRVYPIPEVTRCALLRFERSADVDAALRLLVERRLEPEFVTLSNYDALAVGFAGTRGGVDAQMNTVLNDIAPAARAEGSELSELERESYEQRERAVRRDGTWRLRVVAPPAYPVARLAAAETTAAAAVPIAYPLLGVALHAYGESVVPTGAAPAGPDWDVDGLRKRVATGTAGSGRIVVHAMPDAARDHVDAWGPLPPSFALMRTLKERFDPHGLCNPGRYLGGL
jgi:glycolate oxidase FAD binding subunit